VRAFDYGYFQFGEALVQVPSRKLACSSASHY
jgi:hypothetical protein